MQRARVRRRPRSQGEQGAASTHRAAGPSAKARMSGPPRGYPYGYAPPGYYAAPPGYVLAPPPAYAPPPPRVVVRQTADRTNVVHVPPPRPSGDPMRQQLEKGGRAFFWTQDEEQNLRALVGALGTSQWATVAERLGTKRSAAAVEQRWREHHARLQGSRPPAPRVIVRGATSTPARWSAGEDALLKQLVNENGVGKWELIARRLGTNRHPQDVERRWRESFSSVAPRSAPRRKQSGTSVPQVDGVLQAGLDVARGDFDVAKPTRGTDTDANKLAHVLIRLDGALTNLAKDGHALLVRREEANKKKLECIRKLEEAAQCQKAELILAQSRVNEEGGQAVLDAVDAHWARVYRSHDRRLQAARADLARVEDALVDVMGKMEGGGKVGSKAVLLLPKPAPAPRSQPAAKRARSDDVVFLGSRAAAV